jgi:hypothetical protein
MCWWRIGAVVGPADTDEGFQVTAALEEQVEFDWDEEEEGVGWSKDFLVFEAEDEELGGSVGGEGIPIWDMAAMFHGERTLSVAMPEGVGGDMGHLTKGA